MGVLSGVDDEWLAQAKARREDISIRANEISNELEQLKELWDERISWWKRVLYRRELKRRELNITNQLKVLKQEWHDLECEAYNLDRSIIDYLKSRNASTT